MKLLPQHTIAVFSHFQEEAAGHPESFASAPLMYSYGRRPLSLNRCTLADSISGQDGDRWRIPCLCLNVEL